MSSFSKELLKKPARDIVVIIDADPGNRRLLHRALEDDRWRVFEAATWMEGAVQVGVRDPNLIFLNPRLPDGDGIELIRDVRVWSAVPIILLSSSLSQVLISQSFAAGADQILPMPFRIDDLQMCVSPYRQEQAGQIENAGLESSADQAAWRRLKG